MRHELVLLAVVVVLLSGCVSLPGGTPSAHQPPPEASPMPGSCTTFAVQRGDQVLFANNEDYENPMTYTWVVPSSEDGYGGVYVGYQYGRPQGGMNEKGLAFDGLALDPHTMNPDPSLPKSGVFTVFLSRVMRSCATVEEAVEMMTNHSWGTSTAGQVLVADAGGDAAIIGPGLDGQLAVRRKPAGDGYLVGTNFNVDHLQDPAFVIPCRRYVTAQRMLENLEAKGELSIDATFAILDAVHQEGRSNNTLYSNVFDLKNGVVHLAYWYQFDEVLTLNVLEEVANRTATGKPANSGDRVRIRSLFSEETVAQAERAHQRILDAPKRISAAAWMFIGQAAVCGVLLVIIRVRRGDTPWFVTAIWCVVGLVLGAFGLAVYWLAGRGRSWESGSQSLFAQALGSATLSATGATLAVLIIVLVGVVVANANLGVPLLLLSILLQLLLLRAPTMAQQRGIAYWNAVPKYILVELASGISAVACFVFLNQVLREACSGYGIDLTAPAGPAFLAQFSVYGVAATLVLTPLHLVLVHRQVKLWA